MNPIDLQAKIIACVVAALALFFVIAIVPRAHSASFYPACLKPDGDWVHGLTPKECRQLGGRWYSAQWFNKVRKKVM